MPALTDPLVRAAGELLEPPDWDVSLVSVLRVLLLSVYDLLCFTGAYTYARDYTLWILSKAQLYDPRKLTSLSAPEEHANIIRKHVRCQRRTSSSRDSAPTPPVPEVRRKSGDVSCLTVIHLARVNGSIEAEKSRDRFGYEGLARSQGQSRRKTQEGGYAAWVAYYMI